MIINENKIWPLKYLNQLIKERSVVFLLLPFLMVVAFFILYYGKSESHLMINGWNSAYGDSFFKYITHAGDGLLFALIIIPFLFIRIRWALYMLIASVFTLISVFVLKKILFKGMPRPFKYFEDPDVLHIVDGVKMHSMNSFPSGHTITAFAIFFVLLFIVKNQYLKMAFVLMAILAGYSRVYLSQHFLIDIFFGAILGILIAVLSCWTVDNLKVFKNSWVDRNLLQIFNK